MKVHGGDFLTRQLSPFEVFTPEDFSDEHTMIRDLAERFLRDEVLPQLGSIERQEWQTTINLLKRCGELGLLGIEVPVEYGGEGLSKVSAMIVAQAFAGVASFGVSYGGQSGIGTLPLVYFGSDSLKQRYLPKLCKGELLSAYALSESGSGSDALAARTTATRSRDGRQWILRGEKMWITNAAFADLFVTFAKVDGKDFTCFLVEKGYPGVSLGGEEQKMGLRGSSTRTLVLDDAMVPIENVIGTIGKGHHVAFNILNIGRAKIGAIAVGAGRTALRDALAHANRRIAFGQPISGFGAIQHKLAEMAIRTWVVESMVYRTAALLDAAAAEPLREFAVECSILKVFGSEALDYVVDEAVQIFGGYGYSAEYPVERYYRDARVNRIFEGTNEINRLLIAGMLLKKQPLTAMAGTIPSSSHFAAEWQAVNRSRYLLHELFSLATRGFGESLREEQEVLMLLSDIAMEIYAMDSALCRAEKSSIGVDRSIAATFVNDSMLRIRTGTENLIPVLLGQRDEPGTAARLRGHTAWSPSDTIRNRRKIAAHLLQNRSR